MPLASIISFPQLKVIPGRSSSFDNRSPRILRSIHSKPQSTMFTFALALTSKLRSSDKQNSSAVKKSDLASSYVAQSLSSSDTALLGTPNNSPSIYKPYSFSTHHLSIVHPRSVDSTLSTICRVHPYITNTLLVRPHTIRNRLYPPSMEAPRCPHSSKPRLSTRLPSAH